MKGFNALYFGSYIDFCFEFIPQILLLLCLFGWMDTLIVAKWLFAIDLHYLEENYPASAPENQVLRGAPSVITTMINIFLNGAD